MDDTDEHEQYVVNIGGRNEDHYNETRAIAMTVADAVKETQDKLGESVTLVGKNGGLGGCMKAFGEAYEENQIPWISVLTKELDMPEHAPRIARENPKKIIARNNADRLHTIVQHSANRLLLVTKGGSGTLEELASAICHNEWIIKWGTDTAPAKILIVGDMAIRQWRPILQQVFTQLTDTHPYVERQMLFLSTEYVGKGLLRDEIVKTFTKGCSA